MALYDRVVHQSFSASGGNDLAWFWCRDTVAYLKSLGYTTRGSSINGTSGNLFSATPDGVDHWAGLDATQARGASQNTAVWHVLENPTTGHQVCLNLTVTTSAVTVVFAQNKFENAGVWRGGGTSAAVRPADTTSSPAVSRECATGAIALTAPSGATVFRLSVLVRRDGKGFYSYYHPDSGAVAVNQSSAMGTFPMTQVKTGEVNQYMAFVVPQSALALTNGGAGAVWQNTVSSNINYFTGRSGGAGTAFRYLPMAISSGSSPASAGDILGNTNSNDADPDTAKLPMWSIGLWTDGSAPPGSADAHYRGAIPDVFLVTVLSPVVSFCTFNSRKYLVIGAFAFPYGGSVTPRGTDQSGYIIRQTAGVAPPPPDPIVADRKAMNRAYEAI
jgi:hypothetical protein